MTDQPRLEQFDVSRVSQAFMLGLSQKSALLSEDFGVVPADAAAGTDPALIALALSGQCLRFARPPAQAGFAATSATALGQHNDPRPILPAPARAALNRAMKAAPKDLAHWPLSAALWRLEIPGMRLHPFDLPSFKAQLDTEGMPLGKAEQAFLALAKGLHRTGAAADNSIAQAEAEHGEITEENWSHFPLVSRSLFIRAGRQSDPEAARSLVEDCFGKEPAQTRMELVRALETGLGPDDVPFLEGLAKDRAQDVRKAALDLLGRVKGTSAYEERLSRAVERLSVKTSSLRKRKTITLKKPDKGEAVGSSLSRSLFKGIGITEVAARLGMTPEAFVDALGDDSPGLGHALIQSAIVDGRDDLLRTIAAQLGVIQFQLLDVKPEEFTPAALLTLSERFVQVHIEGAFPASQAFLALAQALRGPLPADLAEKLIGSKSFRSYIADMTAADGSKRVVNQRAADTLALLIPKQAVPSFLERIAPLPPQLTQFAQRFSAFVQALEA